MRKKSESIFLSWRFLENLFKNLEIDQETRRYCKVWMKESKKTLGEIWKKKYWPGKKNFWQSVRFMGLNTVKGFSTFFFCLDFDLDLYVLFVSSFFFCLNRLSRASSWVWKGLNRQRPERKFSYCLLPYLRDFVCEFFVQDG